MCRGVNPLWNAGEEDDMTHTHVHRRTHTKSTKKRGPPLIINSHSGYPSTNLSEVSPKNADVEYSVTDCPNVDWIQK